MARRVWDVTGPLIAQEGMEIVDIEYCREGRGPVLRFYLDREGGVTLDDLTSMSRRLGDVLDAHDVVPGRYTLEVSSPGIQRRLRQPDHFRRYVGERVRVRTVDSRDGRRSFLGELRAVQQGGIVVATGEGDVFIGFEDIARANYEPEALANRREAERVPR